MTAFDKMCLNDLRCEAFTNNQLLAKEEKLWLTDKYCLANFHFLLHFMILNKVQLWITKLALGEGCFMNQFPLSLPCNSVINFPFCNHFHFSFAFSFHIFVITVPFYESISSFPNHAFLNYFPLLSKTQYLHFSEHFFFPFIIPALGICMKLYFVQNFHI